MALVYDRDDSGAELPVYVPRRRRTPQPSALERLQPLIGSLGATVTLSRFLALLVANEAFSERDRGLAQNVWAIGFYEGVRAARRAARRELPPFEMAGGPQAVEEGI